MNISVLSIFKQEAKQKLKATVPPGKHYFFKCPNQRNIFPHILAHRMLSRPSNKIILYLLHYQTPCITAWVAGTTQTAWVAGTTLTACVAGTTLMPSVAGTFLRAWVDCTTLMGYRESSDSLGCGSSIAGLCKWKESSISCLEHLDLLKVGIHCKESPIIMLDQGRGQGGVWMRESKGRMIGLSVTPVDCGSQVLYWVRMMRYWTITTRSSVRVGWGVDQGGGLEKELWSRGDQERGDEQESRDKLK